MRQPQTQMQKAKELAEERRIELSRKYMRVYDSADGKAVIDDIVSRICRGSVSIMNQNPMMVYDSATRRDVSDEIMRMVNNRVTDGSGS